MFDALSIAATGMQAQQQNLENVANNITNAATPAFKKARVGFTELVATGLHRHTSVDGYVASAGVGVGVGIASLSKVFEAGEMRQTGAPLDVAIQGDGFLELVAADGGTAYWRGGSMKISADNILVTQSGLALKPSIVIPPDSKTITIAADGTVSVVAAQSPQPVQVGQLQLVRFTNPAALTAAGDGTYRGSEGAGEAALARPGVEGFGSIAQGFVEGSNVKMVDEMVNLMLAQRAYESSLKVVQAADEMLGMVNNLRK